jgi:hypothetical protein
LIALGFPNLDDESNVFHKFSNDDFYFSQLFVGEIPGPPTTGSR